MALGYWGKEYFGGDPRGKQSNSGKNIYLPAVPPPPKTPPNTEVAPGHPFVPPGLDKGDYNTGSIPKGNKAAQNEDEAGGA